MKNYLDDYVVDLLHVGDAKHNKLIDLGAADPAKTLYLSRKDNQNFSEYMLLTIAEHIGHIAQTVLANSSVARVESLVGRNLSHLDWTNGNDVTDASALDKFIRETYQNISFKGINPLFLSVGALRWQVQISQREFREVTSPLLIFPIKLIRSASSTPVAIEFVDDDIYFNPCLYQKMLWTLPGETATCFPHPNGTGAKFEDPVDLALLGDGNAYFASVEQYVRACRGGEENVTFEFIKDCVAIAQYDHSDLCMYYDYLRNRDRIREHDLVRAAFDPDYQAPESKPNKELTSYPYFVLPHDSVQEDMILRALNGESMVIKGPPGTGKTATIANMISVLMAEQKNVLLVSSKISALSEIYHKIPEELRKFALLLDYESEAQAAKIDPALIKKDLNELIDAAKHRDTSDRVYEERNHARADHGNALAELVQYHKLTFDSPVILGDSYYRALEMLCKHPELEEVEFAKPQQMLTLSAEQYHDLIGDVRDASAAFDILSENGEATVVRNPWYGVTDNVDTDRALAYYEKIAALAESASAALRKELITVDPAIIRTLHPADCIRAAKGRSCAFDTDSLKRLEMKDADILRLGQAMRMFSDAAAACPKDWVAHIGEYPIETVDKDFAAIPNLELNDTLRVDEIRTLYQHKDIFTDARGATLKREDLEILSAACERILTLRQRCSEILHGVWETFRETNAEADLKKIQDAVPALKKYAGTPAEAPGALDFKAKTALKNLLPLCYLADTPFREIVSAIVRYADVMELSEKLYTEYRGLAHLYKKELSDAEINAILAGHGYGTLLGSRKGITLTLISSSYPIIEAFVSEMRCNTSETVNDLKLKYQALLAYRKLYETVAAYEKNAGVEPSAKDALAAANTLCAWNGILSVCKEHGGDPEALLNILRDLSDSTVSEMQTLLAALVLFGEEFFENVYTADPDTLTLPDIEYFRVRCDKRAFANAALQYGHVLERHADLLPIAAFFRPFACGERKRDPSIGFDDYFEHTVYSMAVSSYRAILRNGHHPMGRAIVPNYDKIDRADEEIEKLNRKIIEKKLLSYIQPDDPAYRFLSHERGAGSSVRKLFAENADAIQKLKRCIILSPSTASVLLRHPDFSDFDTVIIDEASQMPSVTLLPVLYRAKQCVIVGDEWQMPPIKHFEAKVSTLGEAEDGEKREDSALSLILRNAAFHVATLICHYRSRTESLIKFSQESFYPVMRTFPSPVPKKEGLGFTDIYLEDGICENGVNECEAQKTVECIKAHFERYYNYEKDCLERSFGVVTFGLPQLERIKSIIKKDAAFKRWHHTAERQDVDDPFFYCTVETVQGQQTADLYLSMTYTGRSSLNQNELGSQIFNVAVSRATDSVTVIHSVKAMYAKPDYVKRYLEIVEFFVNDGQNQFVSKDPEGNFMKLLCDHIAKRYGIARDRVICDYGATKGSVKIPLVILSPDKCTAQLGIFCETPEEGRYHYLDYHVRYYHILCRMRDWNLHRVFIHNWVENPEQEHQLLDAAIRRHVSL